MILLSKNIFIEAGIAVRPIFRPPGFWLSKDSFVACKNVGIKVLALNYARRYRRCYKGRHDQYNYVVYAGKQPMKPTDIALVYHSHSKARDCLNTTTLINLRTRLEKIKSQLLFVFMEEFHGENR